MSNYTQKFAVSLIAGTVILGLSGCSMVPVDPDSRMGRTSAAVGEASGKVWKRTKHVFRISDDETVIANRDTSDQEYDEFEEPVDLALMQNGSASEQSSAQDTVVLSATEPTKQARKVAAVSDVEQVDAPKVAADRQLAFRTDDYTHVVQEKESLWDLSRNLTGDARNWKILAELNELDENGSIYPGQTLHIPADMANGKGIKRIASVAPKQADGNNTVKQLAKTETPQKKDSELKVASALPASGKTDKSNATDVVADIAASQAPDVPKTDFSVQAGETMWDLAKRTTGDATNWKLIAAANSMSEKQASKIRYGQNIGIPNDLLKKPKAAESTVAASSDSTKPVVGTIAKRLEVPATDTTVAGAADQKEGQTIELPATFKADPPVIKDETLADAKAANPQIANKPVAEAATAPTSGNGADTDWVMVSGTYYPKAVYNDANFSATLLMRVSPGTKLLVSRAIGPWFEVKTDRGIGYVHSRDIK